MGDTTLITTPDALTVFFFKIRYEQLIQVDLVSSTGKFFSPYLYPESSIHILF